MIGYTVAQAAGRIDTTTDVIEAWITAGWLVAVRSPVDGHRYIEETHLLDVDQAVYATGRAPVAHPGLMTRAEVATWLTGRGRPTTANTIRDWTAGRLLVAKVPSKGGPGRPALYDPIEALTVANARIPRVGTLGSLRDAMGHV